MPNQRRSQLTGLLTAVLIPMFVLSVPACTQGPVGPTTSSPLPSPTTPASPGLPFTTIEQAEWNSAGIAYEDEQPSLQVVTNSTEASQLEPLISQGGQDALHQVNYQTDMVIAVFQGLKPTNRYGVQIEHITVRDNTVVVATRFMEPPPNEAAGAAVTSPYHVVKVTKPTTAAKELTFELVVSSTVLLSTTHRLSE